MFAKLCLLAAALPAALATIAFDTPTNVTAGLVSSVSWTADDTDPSFSLELNHPSFRNSLALANNVDPTNASPLSIEWPIVPADSQYTLSAVNVSNINQVFATSSQFSIAQAPTTASASVSTTFTTGSSASGASSATGSSSGASTTGSSVGSASGASGASTGSSATGSTSAPSSSGSTGSFNGSGNGAASFKAGNTGVVAVILAAVAGATLFL